jgi:hypothetical protein
MIEFPGFTKLFSVVSSITYCTVNILRNKFGTSCILSLRPPNCYNSHALCLVASDEPIQFFYRVYQNLLLMHIQLALSWARPVMSISPAMMYAVQIQLDLAKRKARRSRRSCGGLLLRDFLLVHLIAVLLAAVA